MRRFATATMLAIAGLLAAPALAVDHTITAGPAPQTYATTSLTIDQGDTVTFRNADSSGALHNVTSDKTGADGKRLFRSALVESGKSAPVNGVEFLTTGDYGYHCSVHPSMVGTLHVSANGTPQERDTTPPVASIGISDARIRTVLRHRALKVVLSTSEPARFKLVARVGRTTIARGAVTLKRRSEHISFSAVRLTRRGRTLLSHRRRVTVRLKAAVADSAGNRSTAAAHRRLRR